MHIIQSGCSERPSTDIGYLSNNNITVMLSTERALSIDFSVYSGITGRLAPCLFLSHLRHPGYVADCIDLVPRLDSASWGSRAELYSQDSVVCVYMCRGPTARPNPFNSKILYGMEDT